LSRAALIPSPGAQHDAHDREHDRDLDEDAADRGEGGARKPKSAIAAARFANHVKAVDQ